MEVEKIIDKVRKLMAKANDPSVTESEAMAYAAKAQKMLEEHNLSLLDITDVEAIEGVGALKWDPKYGSRAWRRLIAISAARVYMCQLVLTQVYASVRGGKNEWRPGYMLVGRKVSVDVAKSMIDYLLATGFRLSKNYSSVEKDRRSFEEGYGIRISQRLDEMFKASAGPSSDGSGLPALYKNELEAAANWIKDSIPGAKTKDVALTTKNHHGRAGFDAANSVSLGAQMEGGSSGAPALPKGALLLASS